jgi:hypothetical protein
MREETTKQESPQGSQGGKPHVTTYFVDNEAQTTAEKELTVKEILTKAKLDPATHYLIELQGSKQIEHKDPNEEIKIHEKMKFSSVFTGETPLS